MPLDLVNLDAVPEVDDRPEPSRPALDPRTRRLIEAPIARTLIALAWPNIAVMLAQASTGLIETWWVSRLGNDALTGMALVFPGYMMMQMLSAGAMGGGISSAISRALGARRRDDADSQLQELPWLVPTVFYLMIMKRRDSAAHAGAH